MNSTAAAKTPVRVQLPIESRPDALLRSSWDWAMAHTTSIIIASIIAGVVVALLLGAKWGGGWLRTHYAESNHWRRIVGGALAKIRLWFIAAVAAQIVVVFAHAPVDIAKIVYFVFVIAATLQAAILARELVLGLIEYRASGAEHAGLHSALGIIRLLVTVILFAIAAVLILGNLGVNVTGLIAGLGVGGIAIGLAAQGIFRDLFAALSILFDRPFRVGDTIKFGDATGSVEAIGLMTTRIRSLDGEQIIMSNDKLLEMQIRNMAGIAERRVVLNIPLHYANSAEQLARLPQLLRTVVEKTEDCRFDHAFLLDFGDNSLKLELMFHVTRGEASARDQARHRVMTAAFRAMEEAGIAFSFQAAVAVPEPRQSTGES
jgi:small-conductance mechanosensitive channel